jgi:hypothetical protein
MNEGRFCFTRQMQNSAIAITQSALSAADGTAPSMAKLNRQTNGSSEMVLLEIVSQQRLLRVKNQVVMVTWRMPGLAKSTEHQKSLQI